MQDDICGDREIDQLRAGVHVSSQKKGIFAPIESCKSGEQLTVGRRRAVMAGDLSRALDKTPSNPNRPVRTGKERGGDRKSRKNVEPQSERRLLAGDEAIAFNGTSES